MQEYAHRETLTKAYSDFSKQLEALGEEAEPLRLKLQESSIDTLAFNPSTTLDGGHGDKLPTLEMVSDIQGQLGKLGKELKNLNPAASNS